MTGERPTTAVPDWQLERYRLGELPVEQAETVRRALDDDASLRERLTALERSDTALLEQYPAPLALPSIRTRLSASSPEARHIAAAFRPLALALGLSAAAVVLGAVLFVSPGRHDNRTASDGDRVKGLKPSLMVYRQAESGVEPLGPGSIARERDVVQLAYQAAGRRYGVIVSVDGRGLVTRHLPSSGAQAAELKSGAPVALPQACQLDDAPRWERFYLVTADEPFSAHTVLDAVRRAYGRSSERLDLPDGLEQSTFVLNKEPER